MVIFTQLARHKPHTQNHPAQQTIIGGLGDRKNLIVSKNKISHIMSQ
jgi:hypothetical protein